MEQVTQIALESIRQVRAMCEGHPSDLEAIRKITGLTLTDEAADIITMEARLAKHNSLYPAADQ